MVKIKNIDFTAIVEGVSKNKIRYTGFELQKTAHELSDKPILKDHIPKVDNIVGRTTITKFSENIKGKTGDIKRGVVGSGDIMDQKMIEMVGDGRARELSISAEVDQLVEESKDSDVLEARGIHYDEISFTPTPGVEDAGVTFSESYQYENLYPEEQLEIEEVPDDIHEETESDNSKKGDKMTEEVKEKKEEVSKTPKEATVTSAETKTVVVEKIVKETENKELIALREEMKKLKETVKEMATPKGEAVKEDSEPAAEIIKEGNKLIMEYNKDYFLVKEGKETYLMPKQTNFQKAFELAKNR